MEAVAAAALIGIALIVVSAILGSDWRRIEQDRLAQQRSANDAHLAWQRDQHRRENPFAYTVAERSSWPATRVDVASANGSSYAVTSGPPVEYTIPPGIYGGLSPDAADFHRKADALQAAINMPTEQLRSRVGDMLAKPLPMPPEPKAARPAGRIRKNPLARAK